MKHIVIHTQYYPPEIGAPQARLSELSEGLSDHGYKVTVLTAMPNYPQGKVYKGYGGFYKEEGQGKIRIIRCGIIPSQKTSLIPRLLSYFSFVFSSFLVGCFSIKFADYLLTESPPLFLGIAGYLLSKIKGAKWIFNVSDLWPESALQLGVINEGLAMQLSYGLESFCYKHAWCISGQSKSIVENIQKRFPGRRTYHLSNGVDVSKFSHENIEMVKNSYNNEKITILYAGLHGIAQGLDQILYAANEFNGFSEVEFLFIGDGPKKKELVDLSKKLGLKNTCFMDAIPRDKVLFWLSKADICLVPLKINLTGAVPSKLYEAMASGKPVLLIADGEAAEIVKTTESGLVVAPGDIEQIIDALKKLINDPELRITLGNHGLIAASEKYDRKRIIDQFVDYLEQNS